jgi:hypothetical protein
MLERAFIISFITIAIHIVFTWKGMLLKNIGDWLELRLNKYIKKPLFTCPMCMSSFWTFVYFILVERRINEDTIITVVVVCGINTLLTTFIYSFHDEG